VNSTELLLIGAVFAVGTLHTMVPDHWLPIALMARQRHWSSRKTALAALQAGAGHTVSTLVIAVVFWAAGAAVATRFGGWIDTATSVALVGFGLWVAFGAIREIKHGHEHGHEHEHGHDAAHSHQDHHQRGSRMALLLILGSSPMIEGIPAFFAAGQYGAGLLIVMALVFAASTISVYVVLSVYSARGLKGIRLGRFERYGELLSGLVIAVIGVAFWLWPLA
jgi:ABC-type nickel/cobalt efflux system permease component RcnA